jgi:hypothetical protein
MKYTVYLRGSGYLEEISIDDEEITSMMGMNEGYVTIEDENGNTVLDGEYEELIGDEDIDGITVEYNKQQSLHDEYSEKATSFCVNGTLMEGSFGSFTFETKEDFNVNKLKFIVWSSLPFFDDYDGIIEAIYYDDIEADFNDDFEFKNEDFAFEECGEF